jgi:transposase InsO family protein
MECLLADIEGIIFLLDDILVTGTKEQHKERLVKMLQRLEDAGLTVQKNKCEFFKKEIQYLGHVIDRYGVRKSADKVKAILNAPKPENVSQLQSFLGLTNYYRNFVPDASFILSPFYNLLHKNAKWEWTAAHETAFAQIKNILASDNTLAHFNPEAKLILTVDASPMGLGAILSQVNVDGIEQPISYASRTLTSAEKKYAQIQKEATAIIFGVRRFHQYLYGRSIPFVLRTDHKPLLTIFGPHKGIPEITANRLQRYAMFLAAYNYTIEYIRSKQNSADYLSRACLTATETVDSNGEGAEGGKSDELSDNVERAAYLNFVSDGDLPVTVSTLQCETSRDERLCQVKRYVLNGWPRKIYDPYLKPYHNCRTQLSYENGCLMRGHKVVIPESLQKTICNELHSSHFGVIKMKAEARKRLWFPGVDTAIERLAASCVVCAQLRPAPSRSPLAPWPLPPQPFYRIHVDFLGPFNNRIYFVIVDAYSKWVDCYDMTVSHSSRAVITKLYDWISRVGIPHTLVSDNGTSFTSQEFKDFCALNGIKHILSPVYHAASNGQCEIFVKIVKKGLKTILLNNTNKNIIPDVPSNHKTVQIKS